MLKNTLIAALLASSGFAALAQTALAPKPAVAAASSAAPAMPAKPVAVAAPATPAAPTAPAKPAAAMTAAAPATTAAPAAPAAKVAGAEPAVKKSKNDICHDKSSSAYKQTTNFTEYKTMDECTKSGGRPPKAGK